MSCDLSALSGAMPQAPSLPSSQGGGVGGRALHLEFKLAERPVHRLYGMYVCMHVCVCMCMTIHILILYI